MGGPVGLKADTALITILIFNSSVLKALRYVSTSPVRLQDMVLKYEHMNTFTVSHAISGDMTGVTSTIIVCWDV